MSFSLFIEGSHLNFFIKTNKFVTIFIDTNLFNKSKQISSIKFNLIFLKIQYSKQ